MASPALTTAESLPTGSGQNGPYDPSQHEDSPETGDDESPPRDVGDGQVPKAQPLQKRRRVTRACDECRRKKIKCDGKQPCTHCTVYSYGKLPILLFVPAFSLTLSRMVNMVQSSEAQSC